MLYTGTAALIDDVLSRHYQIQQAKIAAASYTPLRARILADAQSELIHIWNMRDWVFRYAAPSTVTMLINTNSIALTAGWANEGREGSVILAAQPWQLDWKRLGDIKAKQALYPDQIGIPKEYSVSRPSGVWTLEVFPKVASASVFSLFYQMVAPTLTDSNTGPSFGGLLVVPDEIQTALYEGVVKRQLPAKGDVQTLGYQQGVYESVIFDACCTLRQGKANLDTWPRFPGSAEVWGENYYGSE